MREGLIDPFLNQLHEVQFHSHLVIFLNTQLCDPEGKLPEF